jgi:hypothetical protein
MRAYTLFMPSHHTHTRCLQSDMYAQITRMALGQGLVGGSAASGTVLCTTLPTTTNTSNSKSSSVSDSPVSIGASPQPLARPPLAGSASGTPAAVVSAAAASATTSSNSVMCVPLVAGSFYKSNSGSNSSSSATLRRASLGALAAAAANAAKGSANTEPVTVLAVLEAVRKLDTTTSPSTMIAFSDEVSVMVLSVYLSACKMCKTVLSKFVRCMLCRDCHTAASEYTQAVLAVKIAVCRQLFH